MRIVLINPPSNYFPGAHGGSYPPYGLWAIGSSFKKQGHQVKIIDLPQTKIPLDEIKPTIENSDLIGISCNLDNFPKTRKLIQFLKKNCPAPIVGGGPFATVASELYLEHTDLDWIWKGERESLNPEKLLLTSRGVLQRPTQIVDLDLHYPDYSLINLEDYVHNPVNNLATPCGTIMTARGCPFKCEFCASHYIGRTYRGRSIDSIEKEIISLKKQFGIQSLQIIDGTFTVDRKRTLKFCEMIKKQKLQWSCMTRVDRLDRELILKMAESGCEIIWLGIESFTQKILDSTRKNTTVEENFRIINLLKEAGIKPNAFALFGLPGQNREALDEIWKVIKKLKITVTPNTLYPIPGTPIYGKAKKQGLLPTLLELANKHYPAHNTSRRTKGFNLSNVSNEKIADLVKKIWKHNDEL